MSDVVNTLKRELQQLEKDLQSDPRVIKINKIKELMASYESNEPDESGPFSQKGNIARYRSKRKKFERRPAKGSKQKEVKAEIHAYLRAHNNIAHRKDILDHLVSKKLMGWEKNPLKSLAIYLAGWRDQFQSDGQGNYSSRPNE